MLSRETKLQSSKIKNSSDVFYNEQSKITEQQFYNDLSQIIKHFKKILNLSQTVIINLIQEEEVQLLMKNVENLKIEARQLQSYNNKYVEQHGNKVANEQHGNKATNDGISWNAGHNSDASLVFDLISAQQKQQQLISDIQDLLQVYLSAHRKYIIIQKQYSLESVGKPSQVEQKWSFHFHQSLKQPNISYRHLDQSTKPQKSFASPSTLSYIQIFKKYIKEIQKSILKFEDNHTHQKIHENNVQKIIKNVYEIVINFCLNCQKNNQTQTQNFHTKQEELQREVNENKMIFESKSQRTQEFSTNNTETYYNKTLNLLNKRFMTLSCLDLDFNCFKMYYFQSRNTMKYDLFSEFIGKNVLPEKQIRKYGKQFQIYFKRKDLLKNQIARKNKFISTGADQQKLDNDKKIINRLKKKNTFDFQIKIHKNLSHQNRHQQQTIEIFNIKSQNDEKIKRQANYLDKIQLSSEKQIFDSSNFLRKSLKNTSHYKNNFQTNYKEMILQERQKLVQQKLKKTQEIEKNLLIYDNLKEIENQKRQKNYQIKHVYLTLNNNKSDRMMREKINIFDQAADLMKIKKQNLQNQSRERNTKILNKAQKSKKNNKSLREDLQLKNSSCKNKGQVDKQNLQHFRYHLNNNISINFNHMESDRLGKFPFVEEESKFKKNQSKRQMKLKNSHLYRISLLQKHTNIVSQEEIEGENLGAICFDQEGQFQDHTIQTTNAQDHSKITLQNTNAKIQQKFNRKATFLPIKS